MAITIPVLLLLSALVVDAGNWFTHKRQLQNRADAAALAAGVEYASKWTACVGSDATAKANAAAAIIIAARNFAGDPSAPAPVNTEVADQSKLDVVVNSTSYDAGTDYSDGAVGDVANPCYNHAGDDISPAGGYWTDVKVKERDLQSLFGSFGLPLPKNTARARVEIRPAISDNQFVPLAVPETEILKAQVRYYDECHDPSHSAPLAVRDLSPLKPAYQTASGMTLWGPSVAGQTEVDPTSFDLPVPLGTGCTQPYVPVGVEIRIAGRDFIDLNQSCAALVSARFADCWSRRSEIRVFKSIGNAIAEPQFGDAHLAGGTCSQDPYFSRTTSCTANVSVFVNWGDRDDGPLNVPANFTVTVEGQNLLPPGGSPTGVWSSAGPIVVGASSGSNDINLSYDWEDNDTTHSWRGSDCKKNNGPCRQSGNSILFRTYAATDANSSTVDMLRTSANAPTTAQPIPTSLVDSIPAALVPGQTTPVFFTAGLRSSLKAGQFRVLRAAGPQGNQSLDCEPTGGQGHDFQMFLNGCQPYYGPNTFTNGIWWNSATQQCPSQNFIFNQPNTPANFWQCVPSAPGFSASVIADGIAARTGNCTGIQNNSCSQTQCLHPNEYQEWLAGTSTDQSRIIKLFIVPYAAFKGVNAQDGLPLSDFASFYVTGWGGNGANANPCAGDDPAQPGEIVGYFIEFVGPNIGPTDPNANCVPGQLRPCRAVLVR